MCQHVFGLPVCGSSLPHGIHFQRNCLSSCMNYVCMPRFAVLGSMFLMSFDWGVCKVCFGLRPFTLTAPMRNGFLNQWWQESADRRASD